MMMFVMYTLKEIMVTDKDSIKLSSVFLITDIIHFLKISKMETRNIKDHNDYYSIQRSYAVNINVRLL